MGQWRRPTAWEGRPHKPRRGARRAGAEGRAEKVVREGRAAGRRPVRLWRRRLYGGSCGDLAVGGGHRQHRGGRRRVLVGEESISSMTDRRRLPRPSLLLSSLPLSDESSSSSSSSSSLLVLAAPDALVAVLSPSSSAAPAVCRPLPSADAPSPAALPSRRGRPGEVRGWVGRRRRGSGEGARPGVPRPSPGGDRPQQGQQGEGSSPAAQRRARGPAWAAHGRSLGGCAAKATQVSGPRLGGGRRAEAPAAGGEPPPRPIPLQGGRGPGGKGR